MNGVDPKELQQKNSEQLKVPAGSILYQLVTVNIHYPKSNTWSQAVADLNSYIAAEDKQGGMQVTQSSKDPVQDAVAVLTKETNMGRWNWDEKYYLGNIKMFPLEWRTLVQVVYKKICNGYPSRDYVLTNLYVTRDELCGIYGSVPKIINKHVENIIRRLLDTETVRKDNETHKNLAPRLS
jgi:hypothetical protein